MIGGDPPASPGRGPRRLVVAYDGSDASVRAARFALGLVTTPPMEIWLVHALHAPPSVAEPRTEEEQGSEGGAIEQSFRAMQSEAASATQRVHVLVREGPAAEVVLGAAAEVGADLVVVGTRGLRGARRALLGSVSSAILERATRPVVVVP